MSEGCIARAALAPSRAPIFLGKAHLKRQNGTGPETRCAGRSLGVWIQPNRTSPFPTFNEPLYQATRRSSAIESGRENAMLSNVASTSSCA